MIKSDQKEKIAKARKLIADFKIQTKRSLLKSRATNHPLIRSIGDMYGIGRDTEQEYIIKLDNSTHCNWLDVLQKKD
jgi:hypothetical protein